jgi:hypothetical protein
MAWSLEPTGTMLHWLCARCEGGLGGVGVDSESIFEAGEARGGRAWPGDGGEVWQHVELDALACGAQRRGYRGGSECGGGSGYSMCLL